MTAQRGGLHTGTHATRQHVSGCKKEVVCTEARSQARSGLYTGPRQNGTSTLLHVSSPAITAARGVVGFAAGAAAMRDDGGWGGAKVRLVDMPDRGEKTDAHTHARARLGGGRQLHPCPQPCSAIACSTRVAACYAGNNLAAVPPAHVCFLCRV